MQFVDSYLGMYITNFILALTIVGVGYLFPENREEPASWTKFDFTLDDLLTTEFWGFPSEWQQVLGMFIYLTMKMAH
eukprot:CAMPEP_0170497608 /NCGR_PEP_ID=MMETSP0208-20121228/25230_1 /TAXON_ID=197538 /ORGANISM="Strombidium inclinatum, Strain S3" /LENGTH=76 /DNA_ID=CAMNT_0010774471 /DNA_START=530 /DNA_END=757 /DNA_ORIENTATION=+